MTVRWVPWAVWGLALALSAVGLLLQEATPGRASPFASIGGSAFVVLVMVVALGGVGALIAARERNLVGWVLCGLGLLFAAGYVTDAYGIYGLTVGSLPGALLAAWFSWWSWIPVMGMLAWLLYTFPDGRLPSVRWRKVFWLAAGGLFVLLVVQPFVPGPLDDTSPVSTLNPVNPFGVTAGVGEWLVPVSQVGYVVLALAGLLGGAVSLLFRYRGASGERRYQIKWLAFAAAVSMLLFVGWSSMGVLDQSGVFAFSDEVLATVEYISSASALGLPVAIAVAVFKYRLYDIDLVISKTLVYTGLAGFIGVVYVAIVAGVGAVIGAGGEPNLALSVAATAVVAVAFQPARERLTRLANRLVFGERATPYEVLSRFSAHLGETVATDDTLQRMARLLAEGTGAARAQVWLRIDGQLRPAAVWPMDDSSDEEPEHLVEVVHEGERLGALSLDKPRGETLTGQDERLMADLASQAGLVLRNVRLTEQLKQKIADLRSSRQRLVAAQDDERRRIERDLHDGAQQQFIAVKLKATMAQRIIEQQHGTDDPAAQMVADLADDTDEGIETLRNLAHGIYPPLLAAEGLPGAVRAHGRKAAVPVTVDADRIGRYPQQIEAAVYFCVLEAVNNATKYADPDLVNVHLSENHGTLTFEVTDDGAGFDPATTTPGHGLTNMADRLDALNGTLDINSRPGAGTTIRGTIPHPTPEIEADRTPDRNPTRSETP